MLSKRKYYGHLNTNSKILDRSEWWDGEKKSEEREIDTPHERGNPYTNFNKNIRVL